jgi:hypothetical protein
MNIALVLQHKLLLGIQRLLTASQDRAAHMPLPASSYALPVLAPRVAATHLGTLPHAGSTNALAKKAMPLRVLRVVEKGQPRSCAGRLVISGRMADVCAELDRLVAREATLH